MKSNVMDGVTMLMRAAGLPEPEREVRFDPERRWRFDYLWPSIRLALEIEGGVWSSGRHTRGKGFLGDIEKYNAATLLGFRVIRATPKMVQSGEVAELVKTAFERMA